MDNLKSLINVLNAETSLPKGKNYQIAKNLFENIQDSRVFCLSEKTMEGVDRQLGDTLKDIKNLTIPFKQCSFVGIPYVLLKNKMTDLPININGSILKAHYFEITSINVLEVSPNNYEALTLFISADKSMRDVRKSAIFTRLNITKDYDIDTDIDPINFFIMGAIGIILSTIYSKDTLVSDPKIGNKIKYKNANGSNFIKFKKIIYCKNKHEKDSDNKYMPIGMEYSHRFLVRGHWRKVSSLGKDRSGEYCIPGYTWVTEFEKGSKDLPLIDDKIRLYN